MKLRGRPKVTVRQQASLSACGGVILLALIVHLLMLGALVRFEGAAAFNVEAARLRIDPNVATQAELVLLPGIGETLAERIVRYRTAAVITPAFRCVDDLQAVRGIGPLRAAAVQPFLYFPKTNEPEAGETR